MASPNIYQSGIGGTTGSVLATYKPLWTSGTIYYVSSVSGSDTFTGKERNKPKATIAGALAVATNGDTIAFLANHAETLVANQTISQTGLVLVSEGSGANAASFTRNFDGIMLTLSGDGMRLYNLRFPEGTYTSTSAKVQVSGAGVKFYATTTFLASDKDTGPQLNLVTGANQFGIENATFTSTALLTTAQPESAMKVTNAVSDLFMENVTFAGGVSGWSNPYAFNGAAAITRLRAINISLTGDSDVILATGTTGMMIPGSVGGSNRIVWTA